MDSSEQKYLFFLNLTNGFRFICKILTFILYSRKENKFFFMDIKDLAAAQYLASKMMDKAALQLKLADSNPGDHKGYQQAYDEFSKMQQILNKLEIKIDLCLELLINEKNLLKE